jgi:hypothetical protein
MKNECVAPHALKTKALSGAREVGLGLLKEMRVIHASESVTALSAYVMCAVGS